MLSKALDVGFYFDLYSKVKNVVKKSTRDFTFTKIEMSTGNEMIRTSWFGRHDFTPYVRLDLWKVGFRIAYTPNYHTRFLEDYFPKLTTEQVRITFEYVDYRMTSNNDEKRVQVTRGGNTIVNEPVVLWKDVIAFIKEKGFV